MEKKDYLKKLKKTKKTLTSQREALENQFQQLLGALTVVDGLKKGVGGRNTAL